MHAAKSEKGTINERGIRMQAKDVMTTNVVTVEPDTSVRDIAKKLIASNVSAVPVVERDGRLIGIVSEGDLMRRVETGTERHPSWWLSILRSSDEGTRDFIKTHARQAAEVMSQPVITVREDTPIQQIAELLEKHRIKRVPVVRGEGIVGIVSRANLVRGLALQPSLQPASASDQDIKAKVERALEDAAVNRQYMSLVVMGGVVSLWGLTESSLQKEAARIAAETVPGVREVQSNLGVIPPNVWAVMGGE